MGDAGDRQTELGVQLQVQVGTLKLEVEVVDLAADGYKLPR